MKKKALLFRVYRGILQSMGVNQIQMIILVIV